MENNQSFEYTYSAPEQDEIRRIRDKYLPKDEYSSKLEQLRALDRKTEQKGSVISIVMGVIGTLMFGFSLSCILELTQLMVIGVVVGIVGVIILAMAYPVYKRITRQEKERVAEEILKLTEELMK